ncbi:hypothetical protein GIB67_042945 [Kingdonia uniflora]|uniref:HSA domain-containing protein n=1 Tax=Kingdonia uniflora TaxID=39325 RepID=A0A7J7L639_9MAGN|nr:hypothetical protein GIB67_042945 [Kingdonia uniflora]
MQSPISEAFQLPSTYKRQVCREGYLLLTGVGDIILLVKTLDDELGICNRSMASKGPRSKLDHDTRAKRQKALEAPSEPRRRKTHWDHVLEEMVWLSKDFESERKFKLGLAKRVAVKASKLFLDQPTRGEKKVKEEEQRLRKVALSISKDVKKFWAKIEKLVVYKHQLELDEKKKKTLDKQLNFLLGQTERYLLHRQYPFLLPLLQ